MTTRKKATAVVNLAGTERQRHFGAMTTEERTRDIQAFGREVRQSQASARKFLKDAGILDETGRRLVVQLRG